MSFTWHINSPLDLNIKIITFNYLTRTINATLFYKNLLGCIVRYEAKITEFDLSFKSGNIKKPQAFPPVPHSSSPTQQPASLK